MSIVLEVRNIPPDGLNVEGELPAGGVSLDSADIIPAGSLVYNLRAELAGRELVVRGKIRFPITLVCALCLKRFQRDVVLKDYQYHQRVSEEDIIDLTESIREDIIVALPLKSLCKQDCRGLCPHCGNDRNVKQCSCAPDGNDSRWGALKDFKLPTEKKE